MSELDMRIVALYQDGLSYYAIGRLVHYSHSAVRDHLLRCGITPCPHPRGVSRHTTCVNGHDLSGGNLRIDKRGWRVCRVCERERKRLTAMIK